MRFGQLNCTAQNCINITHAGGGDYSVQALSARRGNPGEPSRKGPFMSSLNKIATRIIASTIVFVFSMSLAANAAISAKELPPRYREWLQRDVAYIITHEEREAFLKLAADADRDNFIKRFWQIRNPNPGAPTNEFEQEHYRRLAYVDDMFRRDAGTPGWQTDKGRVYILFGEPQQKAVYYGYNMLRPMEIWFYQNGNHPSLPPYFYIVFYKPDSGGDFKLYSPYMDGPEKLVVNNPGTRLGAFQTIDKEAGREVARTSLSLLPDEPVDIDTAQSSLQSDILISQIKNLPNLPMEKDLLNHRRELLESVSHRLILGPEFLNVLTVPFRDPDGVTDINYLLRVQKPEDFTIGQAKDGRYYYNLEVTARVLGSDGKPVFTQKRELSRYFDEAELARLKDKTMAIEGRLPLAPGKYKVEFAVNNKIKQTTFRNETEVVVPVPPASGIFITQPIAFSGAQASQSTSAPFSFREAGVKFSPLVPQQLDLTTNDELNILYQLWAPPADPRVNRGKKLIVEYGYGRPGVAGDSKLIRDEAPRDQFDPSGSMLTGKKIPLADLRPGNYRLVITVIDPDTQQKSFASLNFRVVSTGAATGSWYITGDDIAKSVQDGTMDYERALSYQAQGDQKSGIQWLRKAVERNPQNQAALTKLVDSYFAGQAFSSIADLFARSGITGDTDESTILHIAESLVRTGKPQQAVSLLESALKLKQPSGPLYLALGAYYKQIGDPQKAAEAERKGRSLISAATPIS